MSESFSKSWLDEPGEWLQMLLIFASMMIAVTAIDVANLIRSSRWPSSQAVIEGHSTEVFETDDNGRPKAYALGITYLYETDGKLWRGYRPELRATRHYSISKALSAAAIEFPIGSTQQVHFDPEQERGSYLVVGEPPVFVPLFFTVGLLGAVTIFVVAWRKKVKLGGLVLSAAIGSVGAYHFVGWTSEALQADDMVPRAEDSRLYLATISGAAQPGAGRWNEVLEGMPLQKVVALTGLPRSVHMTDAGQLRLEYVSPRHNLIFEKGDSPDFRLAQILGKDDSRTNP